MTGIVWGSWNGSSGSGEVAAYDTLSGAGTPNIDVAIGAFTSTAGMPAIQSQADFDSFALSMLVRTTDVNDAGIEAVGIVADDFLGVGGGGDDVITAMNFGDGEFYGRGGDDRLESIFGDANDSLNGGDGNDRLFGADGDNTLIGGAGDDTLFGGLDGETLAGGAGSDTADYLRAEDDVVVNLVATGPQFTGAGSGVDLLSGIENLKGGAHDDNLAGDDKPNLVAGREGADTLWGGDGADTLAGGAGRDRLEGGAGDDWASYADAAGAVSAEMEIHTAATHLEADVELDTLIEVEAIIGGAFSDLLLGDGGRNTLLGGGANDLISGHGEVDVLDGGTGDDTVSGDAGDDVITGFDGADILAGGEGDDTLIGGAGRDTADYRAAAGGVTVKLFAFGGQDTGGDGVDDLLWIESLLGSAYRDVFTGDAEDNRLDGRGGRDALSGGFGADTLIGGAGKDVLNGGAGGDVMSGGVGKDRYVYASLAESQKVDVDLILDLTGEDRILLTDIDANSRKAGNQAFDLVDQLTGKAGQAALVYDAASDRTRLLLDTNGDAKADGTILFAGDHTDFINFAL